MTKNNQPQNIVYTSFLVRITQEEGDSAENKPTQKIFIRNVVSGEKQLFTSLTDAVAFIQSKTYVFASQTLTGE